MFYYDGIKAKVEQENSGVSVVSADILEQGSVHCQVRFRVVYCGRTSNITTATGFPFVKFLGTLFP